jgi:hypothetical protein
MHTYEIGKITVITYPDDGPLLGRESDANDLIGAAFGMDNVVAAVPAARLQPDFFRLRTGMAGAFIQKFVTYGLRLAIVGDISTEVAGSTALRDFVTESNRGKAVWFVADRAELARRLSA